AEVFSGAGCQPCVGADLAFEALLKRYSAREVVLLFYHKHIPLPDPLTNGASIARASYYNTRAVPAAYLDGVALPGVGGDRQSAQGIYARLARSFDQRLEVAPEVELELAVSLRNDRVDARVAARQRVSPATLPTCSARSDTRKLRLHIALVE